MFSILVLKIRQFVNELLELLMSYFLIWVMVTGVLTL